MSGHGVSIPSAMTSSRGDPVAMPPILYFLALSALFILLGLAIRRMQHLAHPRGPPSRHPRGGSAARPDTGTVLADQPSITRPVPVSTGRVMAR
jgi:hypothetical protein